VAFCGGETCSSLATSTDLCIQSICHRREYAQLGAQPGRDPKRDSHKGRRVFCELATHSHLPITAAAYNPSAHVFRAHAIITHPASVLLFRIVERERMVASSLANGCL
jgi:hypothetical protein